MKWRHTWWCAAALAAFVLGCAEDIPQGELAKLKEATPKKQVEEKPPEDPFAAQSAAAGQASETPLGYGGVAAADNTYGQGAPIKLKSEVDSESLVQAEGGVGKRGQGYGGGIITEPIRQRFVLQDRITFLNMQNTLKAYRAENNNQNPPTIQEYIDKIVTPSGVTLPELSPGQFYVYDPTATNLDDVLLVDQTQQPQ